MLVRRGMDFSALVLRDHDQLDRTLVTLTDPCIAPEQLRAVLDGVRLRLAVHVIAETHVLASIPQIATEPSRALRQLVGQLRSEHSEQQEAVEGLIRIEPGTSAWYDQALQLRIKVLDHATREIYVDAEICDRLPMAERDALASRFVTERLELLAVISPREFARPLRAA